MRAATTELRWGDVDTTPPPPVPLPPLVLPTDPVERARVETRAQVAEEIARALEVNNGARCAGCGLMRWKCHCMITPDTPRVILWRTNADIAREHAREPDSR